MLKLKLIAIFQSIVIVALLFVVAMLLLNEQTPARADEKILPASLTAEMETKTTPTQSAIENETSQTETISDKRIYNVSGEKIFLQDGAYGQIWLPVLADVPADSHNKENFVTRNGRAYYLEDSHVTSLVGIDVSSYQENIDWNTVKNSGIDFVMLRCGFRGYGSGQLAIDKYFDKNLQGAIEAGLDVGVYFYSQAINAQEAIEEAEMTISLIGENPITYPVVFDWEIVTTDKARTDGMSVDTLTECTRAFCDTVKNAGFTPMVYQNKRTSLLKLDLPMLTDYDFWLAEYNDEATYYYDYQIWQYSDSGIVPGIKGKVDINIAFKDYSKEETTS